MKIHWIQHVSFEGLGCIEPWLNENGHTVICTQRWKSEPVPPVEKTGARASRSAVPQRRCFPEDGNVDGLIVMGGPMGVYDEAVYPWLAEEKAFIKQMIDQGKPVLGICLGAQLIAEVLGAAVRPGKHKEIGLFPLKGDGKILPAEFTAFHWHGDTFGIPDGAAHLASSEATENQAFLYQNHVLALQFHCETTEESLRSLYANVRDEIVDAPFIQPLEVVALRLAKGDLLVAANALMRQLLEQLFGSEISGRFRGD